MRTLFEFLARGLFELHFRAAFMKMLAYLDYLESPVRISIRELKFWPDLCTVLPLICISARVGAGYVTLFAGTLFFW